MGSEIPAWNLLLRFLASPRQRTPLRYTCNNSTLSALALTSASRCPLDTDQTSITCHESLPLIFGAYT